MLAPPALELGGLASSAVPCCQLHSCSLQIESAVHGVAPVSGAGWAARTCKGPLLLCAHPKPGVPSGSSTGPATDPASLQRGPAVWDFSFNSIMPETLSGGFLPFHTRHGLFYGPESGLSRRAFEGAGEGSEAGTGLSQAGRGQRCLAAHPHPFPVSSSIGYPERRVDARGENGGPLPSALESHLLDCELVCSVPVPLRGGPSIT